VIFLIELRTRRFRLLPEWLPGATRNVYVQRNYPGNRAHARAQALRTGNELVDAGALRVRVYELFGESHG
jgi:hypothetical protein